MYGFQVLVDFGMSDMGGASQTPALFKDRTVYISSAG
jgi:hypothetical protein